MSKTYSLLDGHVSLALAGLGVLTLGFLGQLSNVDFAVLKELLDVACRFHCNNSDSFY